MAQELSAGAKLMECLSGREVPVASNTFEEIRESDACDEVNETSESYTVKKDTSKIKNKKKNKASNQITKDRQGPETQTSPIIIKPPGYNECLAGQHYIQILQKPPSKHPRAQFLCTICQYYCDTWSVVEQHINKARHLSSLEDIADEKSIDLLPKPLKEQISSVTQLLKRTIAEQGMDKLKERQSIVSQIQSIVDSNFPGCRIELYGSSVYHVGLRTSDVNLNFFVPSTQEGPRTLVNFYEVMQKQRSFRDVESSIYADIPLITFVENDSKLKCSLTLYDSDAFKLSQLLHKYISFDSRVQEIATAFRYWAHLCNLDLVDGGSLPAYAFPILVIYYMQQEDCPVLPVFHELPGLCVEELTMPDKCDIEEVRKLWKSSNTMTLGQLWLGLFKFYLLEFDMNELVVSIRASKGVKRTSKKWTGNRLAIEDPVTFRNVSKTLVNGKTFTYLMTCLRSTFLYFATLQMSKGPIFRRVQQLPLGVFNMGHLIAEREAFLKFICDRHPCFLTEEEARKRKECGVKLLKPSDSNYCNIGLFIVTPDQAHLLFKNFNTKYMVYEFVRAHFSAGKDCPLVCVLCREEGHHKSKCPDEYLPPLKVLPEYSETFLDKLSKICESLLDKRSLTEEDIDERKSIVLHLEEFLKSYFSDASLELFGSSCNGFGLDNSDIDICLHFKDNPSRKDLDFGKLVKELHDILKKYPEFTNLFPIATAKVPILKFTHEKTRLEGDISFYNVLALENTKLLWAYSAIDKRAKILGAVVKHFTKICSISDASKGSLSSYAYVLMVIYFLQQCNPPVLPVLQEIERPDSCEEYIVEGCDTYFYKDLKSLPKVWHEYGKNKKSVGELWIEFLRFYTETFSFSRNVICIRKKDTMSKFDKMWNDKHMAIEDPFDLSHNLGAGLINKMYNYIIKQFRKGRDYFGDPINMPESGTPDPEAYFDNPIFKGHPPDRGCHNCKKIGHIMKDCPNKAKSRSEEAAAVKKFNEKVTVNTQIVTKNRRPVKVGIVESKNFDGGMFKHSNGERGRKVETGWRNISKAQLPARIVEPSEMKEQRTPGGWRNIPNVAKGSPLLYVHPAPHSNLVHPLQDKNVPLEHKRQYQESHREQCNSRDYPRNPPFSIRSHRIGRNMMGRPPPQVRSSELIDVFTQPSGSETIPTLQFYNSVTGRPHHS